MSGDQDQTQKTEEPTQHRLDEARKKGQVASSREVNHAFMILAATVIVVLIVPGVMSDIMALMARFLERPDLMSADAAGLIGNLRDAAADVAFAVILPLVFLIGAALAAGLIQNGPMLSVDSITPKLEKISLAKGMKRLFSLKSVAEFIKGIVKLMIVGTVATLLLLPVFDTVEQIINLDALSLMAYLNDISGRMLIGVLAIVSVIAALDYLYQKFEFLKSMRMTKQEIRDEYKQTEGDPQVKGRLRQIRMERARRRMMAAVPEADVVITNPTHFAVALVYNGEEMMAPKLVAKGVDHLALRIRELAGKHDVPIVENPPLARALYASVDLDQDIPPEHYKAVAEVIGYVMRLKGKLPSARQGRSRS